MVQGLRELVGKTVLSVEVEQPVPDMSLSFVDDLWLKVFCDQTNCETNDDNYSVRVGETIYVVGTRAHIVMETRSSE
jgi:hypothetical protein